MAQKPHLLTVGTEDGACTTGEAGAGPLLLFKMPDRSLVPFANRILHSGCSEHSEDVALSCSAESSKWGWGCRTMAQGTGIGPTHLIKMLLHTLATVQLRLANKTGNMGRLEIKFNGQWGSVSCPTCIVPPPPAVLLDFCCPI